MPEPPPSSPAGPTAARPENTPPVTTHDTASSLPTTIDEWEQKYLSGVMQWDHGAAAPPLVEMLSTMDLAAELPEGPALVPGCGTGYDVLAIAKAGREAVGLDFAPSAISRFEHLRESSGLDATRARILREDFFDHRPERLYSLHWDYTFLCAILPELRPRWATKVDELLAPGGQIATLIYPAVTAAEKPDGVGPPFRLNVEDVRALLEPRWEAFHVAPVNGHESRRGKEWLARWRRR